MIVDWSNGWLCAKQHQHKMTKFVATVHFESDEGANTSNWENVLTELLTGAVEVSDVHVEEINEQTIPNQGFDLDITGAEMLQVEIDYTRNVVYVHVDGYTALRVCRIKNILPVVEHRRSADKRHLFSVGWNKGEMDFGVLGSVCELSQDQMGELRKMIVVGIGTMEDMWRRAQERKCLDSAMKEGK